MAHLKQQLTDVGLPCTLTVKETGQVLALNFGRGARSKAVHIVLGSLNMEGAFELVDVEAPANQSAGHANMVLTLRISGMPSADELRRAEAHASHVNLTDEQKIALAQRKHRGPGVDSSVPSNQVGQPIVPRTMPQGPDAIANPFLSGSGAPPVQGLNPDGTPAATTSDGSVYNSDGTFMKHPDGSLVRADETNPGHKQVMPDGSLSDDTIDSNNKNPDGSVNQNSADQNQNTPNTDTNPDGTPVNQESYDSQNQTQPTDTNPDGTPVERPKSEHSGKKHKK